MQNRNHNLALFLATCGLLTSISAYALPGENDLEKLKQKRIQLVTQISNLELGKLNPDSQPLLDQLSALDQQITKKMADLKDLKGKIEDQSDAIQSKQDEIDHAKGILKSLKKNQEDSKNEFQSDMDSDPDKALKKDTKTLKRDVKKIKDQEAVVKKLQKEQNAQLEAYKALAKEPFDTSLLEMKPLEPKQLHGDAPKDPTEVLKSPDNTKPNTVSAKQQAIDLETTKLERKVTKTDKQIADSEENAKTYQSELQQIEGFHYRTDDAKDAAVKVAKQMLAAEQAHLKALQAKRGDQIKAYESYTHTAFYDTTQDKPLKRIETTVVTEDKATITKPVTVSVSKTEPQYKMYTPKQKDDPNCWETSTAFSEFIVPGGFSMGAKTLTDQQAKDFEDRVKDSWDLLKKAGYEKIAKVEVISSASAIPSHKVSNEDLAKARAESTTTALNAALVNLGTTRPRRKPRSIDGLVICWQLLKVAPVTSRRCEKSVRQHEQLRANAHRRHRNDRPGLGRLGVDNRLHKFGLFTLHGNP